MDFENPKNWEALKREAEKAKATAEERCSQLTPDSDASMDEYAALQKDIAQYEVAIKIATLALKIAAADMGKQE